MILLGGTNMSKLSNAVSQLNEEGRLRREEVVTNFMGGDSYVFNPIDTLKMIAASSIFGEASYYRKDVKDGRFSWNRNYSDDFSRLIFEPMDGKSTTEIFTEAIDAALDYDFKATLELAKELRLTYNMRLNPQVIMVRAAIHPKRKEFSKSNPGKFNQINQVVMARPDEPLTQLTYYMYINKGKKNKIPTILKKSIAEKISELKPFDINKYKNHEIGLINAVRITHANSNAIDELMKTGSIGVKSNEVTWEQLRSSGMSWRDILSKIKLGHMAALRNLRNIFEEINDHDFCKRFLEDLKGGVIGGKQFPFRYFNAYKMISTSDVNHKQLILDTLEECIDISLDNMPKLKGKTMCLSDNSGSAWGAFTSEYGKCTIAEIDNLSSVIAAMNSDEGFVGKFGDKLITHSISKRYGALCQASSITENGDRDVGGSTEGGIWKFFRDAIEKKEHWDNIFIFSDQQAGTGGLYGTYEDECEYKRKGYNTHGTYINVYKLILDYRKINPKVNVFSVQTAGYNNVLIPQMSYRTAMLTGWTGKEIQFASEYIKQWNEIESRPKN